MLDSVVLNTGVSFVAWYFIELYEISIVSLINKLRTSCNLSMKFTKNILQEI